MLIGCRRGAGGVSGSAQLLPQRLVEAEDRSGVAAETVRALEDGQRVLLGTTQGGGRGGSGPPFTLPSLESTVVWVGLVNLWAKQGHFHSHIHNSAISIH